MRRQCSPLSVFEFAVGLLLFAAPGHADLFVSSEALGSQLAGGTITVTFLSGFETPAVGITSGPGDAGLAALPNYFDFSVAGNTFVPALWTLTNNTTADTIVSVLFDLTNSISLFDTGPAPTIPTFDCGTPPTYLCGTLDSRTGIASGLSSDLLVPQITSTGSGELMLWPDSNNTGDMFLQQRLNWENNDFTAGRTATWYDDTDYWVVPEPASVFLIGSGLIAVALWRRRARRN